MPRFLPASELCNLLKGPKIRILHASTEDNDDETPQPIYHTFPKRVAIHFSRYIRDCFPSFSRPYVSRKGCNGTDTVTIYGGVAAAHLEIFRWMLASCDGREISRVEYLPFSKYVRIHEAAEILGVNSVKNNMWNRMNHMAAKQVPIDDVRMVYMNYAKSTPVRQLVICSIGEALYERRLRNFQAYKEFKEQCQEYDEDIHEYLSAKRKAVYEEQKRAAREAYRASRKLRGEKKGSSNQNRREAGGRTATTTTTTPAGNDAATSGQPTTKTISAVVTRKAQGGRPGYAKVELSDLGITKAQFTSRGNNTPNPRNNNGK
ncbi:hypothetical protein AJ79_00767 [Helicocarpus griseus UAMH5409]|uniref:BTB domain-containing protein n=1 Tax=Helicocarpus griseus UAMH5409 TaxID=1447875 RepID=A0A2B7YB39_9EURO|nr:hypothetical protein AJ79_00767 [Helicocarpus griseus UAMH5409]